MGRHRADRIPVIIRFEPELLERLQAFADRNDLSRHEAAITAIRRMLDSISLDGG